MKSLLSETFDQVVQVSKDIGRDFGIVTKGQLYKFVSDIGECLYSPRWTSTMYPDTWQTIKELEKDRYEQQLQGTIVRKRHILSQYLHPQKDFIEKQYSEHSNVAGHSLQLRELYRKYPCDCTEEQKRKLLIAFLIHDLSEKRMRDHEQSQGKKTPEFKDQEYQAGRQELIQIFQDFSQIQSETLGIHDELSQHGRLYTTLKIYEEMSHLLGGIDMIEKGYLLYEQEKDFIQQHIDTLLSKSGNHPIIKNFLQNIQDKLPNNTFDVQKN